MNLTGVSLGRIAALALLSLAVTFATTADETTAERSSQGRTDAADPIERGRYLASVAACNDCHTAGYATANGEIDEQAWLLGDTLGWRGPWGTTYPSNLRLRLAQMTEDQWLVFARSFQPRPPMPWFNVRQMTDDDLRAFYRFVRYLGPAGEPAPAYLPPDQEPAGPYIMFPMPPS